MLCGHGAGDGWRGTSRGTFRDRVAELAKDQQAYAALVKELTDQLNAVTEVAHATAARARLAVIFAAAGVGLGLLACVLALLR